MTISTTRSTATLLTSRTRLISLRESTITLRITTMTAILMMSIWMVTTLVRSFSDSRVNLLRILILGYTKTSLENMNDSDDMDVDVSPMSSKSIKSGIERMLELGRELLQMSLRLEKKNSNVNDEIVAQNRKMMEVSVMWVLTGKSCSVPDILIMSATANTELVFDYLIRFCCGFRRHLVYWLIRIPGRVRWANSSLRQSANRSARNSIQLF